MSYSSMLRSTYKVVPTSRLEALSQLPHVQEPGHFDVLYEPTTEETSYVASQECKACGAMIMDKCATTQNQWVCAFCNGYNELIEKPSSSSYTCFREEVSASDSLVLLLDLNGDDANDLCALKKVLKESLSEAKAYRCGIITIDGGGQVTLHFSGGPVSFSSEDNTITSKAGKQDLAYFEKKLPDKETFWRSAEDAITLLGTLTSVGRTSGLRHKRATGLALFLSSLFAGDGAILPVLSFLMGPCTIGPGKVVPKKLKHHMRQHHDLDSDKDKYFSSARSFYGALSKKIGVRVFVSSLDQIGIVEMLPLCSSVVQFDSFDEERFANSLKSRILEVPGASEITVYATKGLLIDGCYGNVTKLKHTQPIYSDTPCGVSGTNRWACSSSESCVSFSFRVDTTSTKAESLDTVPEHMAIQLKYAYVKGSKICTKIDTLIIATTNHNMSTTTSIQDSFDSDTALTCLMKQIAFDQAVRSHIHSFDLEKWRYKIDSLAAAHYKLRSKGLSEFLEYLYRLKWTPLLQKRNTSPDESALFQLLVLTKSTSICELLCKPRVVIFAEDRQIEAKNLDEQLLRVKEAMCVDGGNFVVVRFTGESENAKLASNYAQTLVNSRWPPPLFKKTSVGGSQDRFFISSLIPLTGLHTEDISLTDYLDLIRKISQDM